MQLVFATNNKNKIEEVKQLLSNNFSILSLLDINCEEELPETGNTLEYNASEKAWHIYKKFKKNCFADDTGLEIDALDGRPGVISARYASEQKNAEDNINKVLLQMKNIANKRCNFKTIMSLIINNKEYLFKGIINGTILSEPKGKKGFGYDPIFLPEGFTKSFAEMDMEEKNKISHRALAVKKLVAFLNDLK